MRARIMTLPVCVRSRKHKPWSSNDLTYPLRKADENVHERANAAGNEAGRDPAGVFRSFWRTQLACGYNYLISTDQIVVEDAADHSGRPLPNRLHSTAIDFDEN